MNKTAAAVCKAFIEKCSAEKREQLFHLLPAETRELLRALPSSTHNPVRGFHTAEATLKTIHSSWLALFLRMLPKNEIVLFLSCLPAKQAEECKKLLLYSNHLLPLTAQGRAFLQEILLQKCQTEDVLPIECLPASPLNELLTLSYNQLLRLIQFLGLHDLAVEMKQIIETARLKQISAALDSEEQLYIKHLMQKKELVTFKKMALEKWKGDQESLKTAVEKRGINRLAKALFGADPSLLWHVKHHLDTDRAESLDALCAPLEKKEAAATLAQQITFLISHLKKGKSSS